MNARTPLTLGRTMALAGLSLLAIGLSIATAQEPEPFFAPPGTAVIWTDQTQYVVNSPITYCFRIPMPGFISIVRILPDGTTRPVDSGVSTATTDCRTGIIGPPTGRTCLQLTFPQRSGVAGVTQTCFQVVGTTPPPPVSDLVITINRPVFRVGDPALVCYRVPAPGSVTIISMLADGTTTTFASGIDDGTGGCIPGTITPPPGTACLTITWATVGVFPMRQSTAQTCYQVIDTAPAPPSDWVEVGSALIDASGGWTYNQPVSIAPGQTYLRVTSGGCADDPSGVAVWESNLQRQTTSGPGVEVFSGALDPVGLIASTGTSGYGFIARPPVANAQTQTDVVIFGIPSAYEGVQLRVCFRTP